MRSRELWTTSHSEQRADGGWEIRPNDISHTIVTAEVLSALGFWRDHFDLSTLLDVAQVSCWRRQNPDGGFGSSPSTPEETALVLIALSDAGMATPSVTLGGQNYLADTQLPDGSWEENVFVTSAALRVLGRRRCEPPFERGKPHSRSV